MSSALMRLFPNFFLWYFSTTKQYLFIFICTGRYDAPLSSNKIVRKFGRHGQNLQARFTQTDSLFQVKTWLIFRNIIRYLKHSFYDFWKNASMSCGLMYRIVTSDYPKRGFGLPWMFRVIFGVVDDKLRIHCSNYSVVLQPRVNFVMPAWQHSMLL